MLTRGLLPALLSGLTAGLIAMGMNAIGMVTLTGVAAGLGVILVMLVYLLASRKPLWDKSVQSDSDRLAEKRISFWRAVSPWLILTGFAVIVNAPFLPFFELTFTKWAMPLEVIPGAPEKMRLLWQAYFWILVSTLLALPFLKADKAQLGVSLQKWIKRAPRPMLASAVFFAIAFIINHSGKGLDWTLADPNNNMVVVLANASTGLFGKAYPFVAPFLGLLGGFVSGSETSSIAMFTNLHLSIAEKIGVAGVVIAAASGIGGGLASVISPAKLQNAAASIDRIGEEAGVLRVTFVISLIITAVAALLTLIWA
jgi:lactate permease